MAGSTWHADHIQRTIQRNIHGEKVNKLNAVFGSLQKCDTTLYTIRQFSFRRASVASPELQGVFPWKFGFGGYIYELHNYVQ